MRYVAIITGTGGLQDAMAERLMEDNIRVVRMGCKTKHKGQKMIDTNMKRQVEVSRVFEKYGRRIRYILHASDHKRITKEELDYTGVLPTTYLLEATKKYCASTPFIYVSSNKVYNGKLNDIIHYAGSKRVEVLRDGFYYEGITEEMYMEQSIKSPGGAACYVSDVVTQDYGMFYGMRTACFRLSDVSGPRCKGRIEKLVKNAIKGIKHEIRGYGGLQVTDTIHVSDVVEAFMCYYENPKGSQVYNLGGGRYNNYSVIEVSRDIEKLCGERPETPVKEPRTGDFYWYITNNFKFKGDYPEWALKYKMETIIKEELENCS